MCPAISHACHLSYNFSHCLFTQPPMRRKRICFTDVFLFFLFFSRFFPTQNTRQPFSGTAERIFMKLLPNDTGENGVYNVVPPPGEWRMLMTCVIYAMPANGFNLHCVSKKRARNIMPHNSCKCAPILIIFTIAFSDELRKKHL